MKQEIHIAQFVVTGTNSLSIASKAIKRATTWKAHRNKTAPKMTINGERLQVWLRGHYMQKHGIA